MLQGLVNKEVIIRIKWGQEYTGRLVSVDSYMNIQLSGAKEWKDGVDAGTLGQVLIR
jgi:small nuclear ribonucleoprotein F